jgi:hypothetical protein
MYTLRAVARPVYILISRQPASFASLHEQPRRQCRAPLLTLMMSLPSSLQPPLTALHCSLRLLTAHLFIHHQCSRRSSSSSSSSSMAAVDQERGRSGTRRPGRGVGPTPPTREGHAAAAAAAAATTAAAVAAAAGTAAAAAAHQLDRRIGSRSHQPPPMVGGGSCLLTVCKCSRAVTILAVAPLLRAHTQAALQRRSRHQCPGLRADHERQRRGAGLLGRRHRRRHRRRRRPAAAAAAAQPWRTPPSPQRAHLAAAQRVLGLRRRRAVRPQPELEPPQLQPHLHRGGGGGGAHSGHTQARSACTAAQRRPTQLTRAPRSTDTSAPLN